MNLTLQLGNKKITNGDKLYICLYNGSAYEWKEL